MIIHLTSFLLISVVIIQPSDEHPVGILQPDHEDESQSILTEEKEPAYSVPEQSDGEDVNLLKGEGEDEREEEGGEQGLQELSPNTADTMRKINPLTIADQVSQIFRKGGQKVNLSNNKSGGGFRSAERTGLRSQETDGEQSWAMPTGPDRDTEDSPVEPGYVRQAVPRIVSKPRSNDYGYSVIVMAGDALHMPVKVQGKSARGQGKGTLEDKDEPARDVYRSGEAEEKINVEERTPKKEVRVYKQFSKSPDFPIYDEDFNFVPDPFQGIMDDNYKIEVGKDGKKSVLPDDKFRTVDTFHRVHVRSDDDEEDAGSGARNVEKVACNSWGKGNVTESKV